MSYRDDVDTLYSRAMILQKELDAAKAKLDARDAELARLRGGSFEREATSPGIVELRKLPDPTVVLERLVDTSRSERRADRELDVPPLAMPDWSKIAAAPAPVAPRSYLELARDRLASLQPEDLTLITKLIVELTDERSGMDDQIRARLRWLASEIALIAR